MSVSTFSRDASFSEVVSEMDRRGAVIEKLEAERDKFMWQVRDTCTRAEKAESALHLLRDAAEWCLARDERNGSLPPAYAERLRAALLPSN